MSLASVVSVDNPILHQRQQRLVFDKLMDNIRKSDYFTHSQIVNVIIYYNFYFFLSVFSNFEST